MNQNRYVGLDYLRGLAACGIMLFHYYKWSVIGEHSYTNILERIGIYGVSIFYILSGLTLFLVYKNSFNFKIQSYRDFFIKRLFRIFPLLVLTIALRVLFVKMHLYGDELSAHKLWLNFTGLFGLLAPNECIVVGGWSIGNELVFYLLFPILLLTAKYQKALFYFILCVLLCVFIYYAFNIIPNYSHFEKVFPIYVHPLNQAFLFASGITIGSVFYGKKIKFYQLLILIGIVLFCIIPVANNKLLLISGINRIYFSAICMLVCIGFYYIPNPKNAIQKKLLFPFQIIAEASYSIYLIHPIVWDILGLIKRTYTVKSSVFFASSFIISILLGYAIYRTMEKPMIDLGKKLLLKLK